MDGSTRQGNGMVTAELTAREQQILFHVIDDFIRHGEPVSSAAVAKRNDVDVSSATVRNTMAALEEAGYLSQPHTSAGRVPTPRGMRNYVDLIASRAWEDSPLGVEFPEPPADDGMRTIARWASSLLSEHTDLAGLVMGPDPRNARIRDVRLVSLGPRRVLAIFVEDDGSTLERITTFEEPVDPKDLVSMQNYLAELGRGETLLRLRARVRGELTETRTRYKRLRRQALAVAHEATREHPVDLHVDGAFKFVEFADDLERIRDILRALEEKEHVIEILDQVCENARSPVTVIGPESGWEVGDDLSFVLCGYYRGPERAGVVGVLGPMRMDYARVIPLVDRVARVLNRELEVRA
jgi:heat-inducible transcriptional repressor